MAQQHYSNDVSVSVSQKVDALDYAKLEVRRDGQLLQLVLGAVADWWYWRRSPCRVSCVGGRISVKVRLQISLVVQALHAGHLGDFCSRGDDITLLILHNAGLEV